jgi:3-keto-5-aminohexanoate cleavage enzyme
MSKAILTCALNGVLTDPRQHPMVPVTPGEMAQSARQAFEAGASIMHVHFRSQEPGMGHLPGWEPELAAETADAIRSACPGVILNQTTGIIGPDISGPAACLKRTRPEIAACNAGSLNYLKLKANGQWAWPPLLFDNPVSKVSAFLGVMAETGSRPEFECFDLGIVRSVRLYVESGMTPSPQYNFVMGVASGMPVDEALLPFLLKYRLDGAPWQTTLIGRAEIWPVHQRAAGLGGMLRTGLEDTFYLPDGERASGNGALIEALAKCAHNAGRAIASPEETKIILNLGGKSNGELRNGGPI